MSATTQPTSSAAPAPSAPRRSAGRNAVIWLGAAAAVFGALLAIAGGAIVALFGTDGVASTQRDDLSTPTSAIVSGTASIDTAGAVDDLGDARIVISSRSDTGRPVFVGVGPAADVDRYLAGAPTDEVRDFDAGPFDSSFDVDRERHPGQATPAAPGGQDFWVASDEGVSANVRWKVRDGDYRVVIMNADGSRGVATDTTLGAKVPLLPAVGFGLLGAGLALAAGGITAVALGARRPR
jgi:hypothetical protein